MDRATRDRLKTQAEEARRAKAPTPATTPAATPSHEAAPSEPAGSAPDRVTCSCGHVDQNRPCGACRNAAQLAKAKKNQAKRNAAGPPSTDCRQQRLPDGAAFAVAYDAAATSWTGKLTIGEKVFEGKASGVFRLLKDLDAAYRGGNNADPGN